LQLTLINNLIKNSPERCKVCNSHKLKYKFYIKGAYIYKCTKCKAYITNNDEIVDTNVYNDINYFEGKRKIISNSEAQDYFALVPAITMMKEKLGDRKFINFLEIGPGGGGLSIAAQKEGWNVYCLDVSSIVIDNLKNYGISGNVYNGKEFSLDDKYDIVVMKHVLEHINEPRRIIKSIFNVLNNDGIFYIQVPNTLSFDRFYHRKKWSGWDIPYHLVHYNYISLKSLLKDFGMKIIYYNFTFFNIIDHFRKGIQNKDIFGDFRYSINKKNTDTITKNFLTKKNNIILSGLKKMIKFVFSERDIIVISRKSNFR
jgi:SAM-dependent methyltransferase